MKLGSQQYRHQLQSAAPCEHRWAGEHRSHAHCSGHWWHCLFHLFNWKNDFYFIFPSLSCIFLLSGTDTNAMSSKSSQCPKPKWLSLGVSSWCFTDILPFEFVASFYICSCIPEIAAKTIEHTGIFFMQDEKNSPKLPLSQ